MEFMWEKARFELQSASLSAVCFQLWYKWRVCTA